MNEPRGLTLKSRGSSFVEQPQSGTNFTGLEAVWGPIPSKRYNAVSPIHSNVALPDLRHRLKSPSNRDRESITKRVADSPNDKDHARSFLMSVLLKTRNAICCSFSCFKCCQRQRQQQECSGNDCVPLQTKF